MNNGTLDIEPRSVYCEETISTFVLPEEHK